MSEWISVNCKFCGTGFKKKQAEIRRSPNNFCSRQCSASDKSKNNDESFYKKCRKTDGCWIWTEAVNGDGYGITRYRGIPYLAHRASYEKSKGEIPDGLCVMHSCDNPACVNPDHLSVGTQAENIMDMIRKCRNFKKIDMDQVADIQISNEGTSVLAARYEVSERLIRKIRGEKRCEDNKCA